ncbi:esterase [Flavobacterium magnum]|uniref:Esterase n=1 Tax=Flavobacterium magnum TaxID=2162713 RepID=A0A2S0RIK3_9FLAO|nr:alpha/beta hydrolase-fold protein [Flavobacterium magnum]AWA31455.1 esterase [Flavobacterium magnum]
MKIRAVLYLCIVFMLTQPVAAQNKKSNGTTEAKPFVLGVVDEYHSAQLNENRILNIYLPEGYDPDNGTKYPVIYLLDGSADEDFIHVVGLLQFYNFDWINLVPKSIVVGIASVDRQRDFTFPTTVAEDRKKYPTTGHSDRFMAFIEKELQPYIEKKYHAGTERTIIGQSLGGLLATEILFKKTQLFNRYIIISPSLWWDNGSLLNEQTPNLRDVAVYLAVGKEGLTPTATPRVMEVDANVLSEKLKKSGTEGADIYFDYLPEENHATIMHQAVMNAFKYLYRTVPKK